MSAKKPSGSTTSPSAVVAKPRPLVTAAPEALPTEAAGGSLDEIADRLREREAESRPARRAVQAKRDQEVLESAATVTAESAVRAIGDLKVTIDSTLDQLSQQLVEQAKKLTAVQEAVVIRRQQLAELYDIEVVAETLAALIRDHEQKKLDFVQDAEARKRDFEREMQEARARQTAALKAKDFEGTEKLLQQRIHALEALVGERSARIEELQNELREATVKVRDIAVKAIEGASGAAALTHVSGIALQQAKGRDDRS